VSGFGELAQPRGGRAALVRIDSAYRDLQQAPKVVFAERNKMGIPAWGFAKLPRVSESR
jgi:hypothetical protein